MKWERLLDGEALRRNWSRLKEWGLKYAVVKSEAYGHGLEEVVRILREAGQARFAVSTVEEGVRVRENAPEAEVLVMGRLERQEWRACQEYGLCATIQTEDEVELAREVFGGTAGEFVQVFVNTGMNRLGLAPEAAIRVARELGVRRLYTHLSAPDDAAFTGQQVRRFREVCSAVGARETHVLNSGAILRYPQWRTLGGRAGILLYGYTPEGELQGEPVLRVYARVELERWVEAGERVGYGRVRVRRRTRVGVVPVGYAHGIPWCEGLKVWAGREVPLIGRPTMDYLLLDLTEAPSVRVGDRVEILGPHVHAGQWAARGGSLVYGILCQMGQLTRTSLAVARTP